MWRRRLQYGPRASLPSGTYDSHASVVIAITILGLGLCSTLVLLRIYTRLAIMRKFGADDWAAVISLALVLAFGICVGWGTKYGLGRHIDTLDGPTIVAYRKAVFSMVLIYQIAMASVKSTFLLQYLHTFPIGYIQPTGKSLLTFAVLWGIAQALGVVFHCIPVQAFWDATVPGNCINVEAFWYTNAAVHILTDILILTMPLPVLWHLRTVPKGQRHALLGLFSLGFFTCAISVIRAAKLPAAMTTADHSWEDATPAVWSVSELSCGIICVCVPTLRPLFFGKQRDSPGGTHTTSSNK